MIAVLKFNKYSYILQNVGMFYFSDLYFFRAYLSRDLINSFLSLSTTKASCLSFVSSSSGMGIVLRTKVSFFFESVLLFARH